MTTIVKPHQGIYIEKKRDLMDYLTRASKPEEQWRIGMEVEKLVVDMDTGEAASFNRIETLLTNIARSGKWQPIQENNRIIGLKGASSSITLEPGGQLELSGDICPDIHTARAELYGYIADIVAEAGQIGLCFLGLGVQPFTPIDKIDWLPKERYSVMGPYMLKKGDMGQVMMKQSAGLQVNLDFSDERVYCEMMRAAFSIVPLIYALFANSPIREGVPTGFLSTRGEIWSRTDRERTGIIHKFLSENADFETYVDYALNIPMYFIIREGRLINLTGEHMTFSRYLSEGFNKHRATVSDWDLHLSTIFPEARMRPQIEIRTSDSLPPHYIPSLAALVKGLLYDKTAREETWSIFKTLDNEEREKLYTESWRLGLKTPVNGRTLREVAIDSLDIARESLKKQGRKNDRGIDETVYLEGAMEIAESGITLAERLLSRWKGSRKDKLAALIEHCSFG